MKFKVKDHSPTITIYAIGTTSDAYTPELELMASEKRNARKRNNLSKFLILFFYRRKIHQKGTV